MKIRSWVKFLFIILAVLFIINVAKDILRLWRAGDRLKEAQKTLALLEEEKLRLEQERQFLESAFFFEQQARDKLNMAMSDEVVVILPQGLEDEALQNSEEDMSEKSLPIWQQWLAIFW